MNASSPGIMANLKDATWQLHQAAEKSPFQQQLVRGELSADGYREFLIQMFHLHSALEQHLRCLKATNERFGGLLRSDIFREQQLRDDLAFWGGNPAEVAPNYATQKMIDFLADTAKSDPVSIIGCLYVLEGSTNGSKYIAKAVTKSYGIDGSRGISYLDPYGDSQRDCWNAFKTAMDGLDVTAEESQAIIVAARATFIGITSVGEAILQSIDRLQGDAASQTAAPRCPFAHLHS